MFKYFLLFIFLIPISSHAAFFMQYSLNYESDTDSGDAQEFTYSKMNNTIYLASTLDEGKKFSIGQSFTSWTKTQSKGSGDTETSLTLLEFGPKLFFYFTKERSWFTSITYNFYVSGSGKISGSEVELSGTSILGSIGYHYKINKVLALGASLNYHQTTITDQISNSTTTTVSNVYTSIYPMIEFAIRY